MPPPEAVTGFDWSLEDGAERRQAVELETLKTVFEIPARSRINVRTGGKVVAAFPESVGDPLRLGETSRPSRSS
jgi:hypothetical protein